MEIYRGIMKNDPRRRWRGSTSTAINRIAVFDVSSNLYLDIGRSIRWPVRCTDLTCRARSRFLFIDRRLDIRRDKRETHFGGVGLIFSFFFSLFFWSMMDMEFLLIFSKNGDKNGFFEQLWLGFWLGNFLDNDVQIFKEGFWWFFLQGRGCSCGCGIFTIHVLYRFCIFLNTENSLGKIVIIGRIIYFLLSYPNTSIIHVLYRFCIFLNTKNSLGKILIIEGIIYFLLSYRIISY